MAIQSNFPSIRPSLLLDFANTQRLDPRITFTRATSGTYYNGVTTAKAEENLLLQSGAMTVSPWGVSNSGTATSPTITANAGTSPDGTTTASRYILQLNSGTTTSDISFLRQNYTTGSGQDYTFSVWIKSYDGTSTYAMQLVGAGAVQSISVGGTWQRFTVTGSSSSTQQGLRIRGGQNPTNDDSVDILVWGAQFEQRSAVTAYTATTTQPITNYVPVLLTAPAGVARFQHNPVTGESLGLLIEEQRTNLVTYSDDFADASWTKTRSSITSNTIVAPDGTLTGDKLVENTATNTHYVAKSVSFVSGTTYTLTVYAKAAERNFVELVLLSTAFGGNAQAFFDLQNGTAGTKDPDSLSQSITPVGNGWYRCQVSAVATVTITESFHIRIANSISTDNYTGDGYSGIFIWGAQLEAGAFETSYIPTVASSVTRNADVASMTGTNFSSWYNQSEGTLLTDFSFVGLRSVAGQRIITIDDGSNNNFIAQTAGSTNTLVTSITTSGSSVMSSGSPATTFSASTPYKMLVAYQQDNSVAAVNGTVGTADTSNTIPTVTTLRLAASSSASTANCWYRRIAYYPVRVTNAELQALTG